MHTLTVLYKLFWLHDLMAARLTVQEIHAFLKKEPFKISVNTILQKLMGSCDLGSLNMTSVGEEEEDCATKHPPTEALNTHATCHCSVVCRPSWICSFALAVNKMEEEDGGVRTCLWDNTLRRRVLVRGRS